MHSFHSPLQASTCLHICINQTKFRVLLSSAVKVEEKTEKVEVVKASRRGFCWLAQRQQGDAKQTTELMTRGEEN